MNAPASLIEDLLAIKAWSQRPAAQERAEVDSINVVMGDGINVMSPGIAAALFVDFRARITGSFIQEFDGTAGTIQLDVQKAQGGLTPSFVSIVGSTPPTIASTGRYAADLILTGWTTDIARGDVLRFHVTST